jgi:5-formyltetrahydrofolate cyclo-ligase
LLLWFESNGSHRHLRVTPLPSPLAITRRSLRAQLLAQRRTLAPRLRSAAARAVAAHIDRWLGLRSSWRVAVYAALPHELDTTPLIELARRRGCQLYLPRIDRHRLARGMKFVALDDRPRTNRLGIAEPQNMRIIGARWLDLVFLPLVGFDHRGVRLGTGGGYYDRAFAFRRWRTAWHTPQLIGLAYSFQQVAKLEMADHDVLLDAVVTEKGVIRCATG